MPPRNAPEAGKSSGFGAVTRYNSVVMNLRRYATFARRTTRAFGFGFAFYGTTKSSFPGRIRLRGAPPIDFKRHGQPSEFFDLVNVILDDDYGLRYLHRIRTIVDIGANIGLFSAYARHAFPDAVIHAYEPNPASAALAAENLASRATVFAEGVSGRDGRGRIVHRSQNANADLAILDEQGDITLVSLATVLDRIGGSLDLLKIDCEGAEWSFMTDRTLFGRVRHVRMEYHLGAGHMSIEDVKATATRLGFTVSLISSRGPNLGIAWLDRE